MPLGFHMESWCSVSNVAKKQETVRSNWELCLQLLAGSKRRSEECGKACQATSPKDLIQKNTGDVFISLFSRKE